jgi:hypothetical protein
MGNNLWALAIVCASPLAKYSGTGSSLRITPRIRSSEELPLHIVVLQHVPRGCLQQPAVDQNENEFDVRLRAGEVETVRVGSQLAIALASPAQTGAPSPQ